MKVFYRKINHGIEVLRCFQEDSEIWIPAEIDGLPVVRIGDYAFSGNYEKEGSFEVWEDSLYQGRDLPAYCGERVEAVHFPEKAEAIGRYAFYGCRNLKALFFRNRLLQLGAGIFTGCRGRMEIEITFEENREPTSCLREICGEIRYELDVTCKQENGEILSYLIFPEHYEEAVENTPARILFTQHHGSGNHYRQCFFQRKIKYEEYDRQFPLAEAQESMEVLAGIVYGRLRYPTGLTEQKRKMYVRFGRNHSLELALVFCDWDTLDGLRLMEKEKMFTEEAFDGAMKKASDNRKEEVLSYLMEARRKLFPPKRKTFKL